jgi:hypothetical protein
VAGMVDGPPSNVGPAERLTLLKEHQRAWETLTWKMSSPLSGIDAAWECLGGVLAHLSDWPQHSVIVQQLPSVLRGIDEEKWTINLNFSIADFTIDPSQDLILAIQKVDTLCVVSLLFAYAII